MRQLPAWTEREALTYAQRAIDEHSRKTSLTVTDLRGLTATLKRALKMAETARRKSR